MALSPRTLLDEPVALRRIHPGEAPYPGRLHATNPPSVWVDIALVPEVVWRCDPEGHILVPTDVARTRDGHAAIVPHCARRLAGVVSGCSPGAAVTVAVSILRAASEARAMGIEDGSWWVDSVGRPVLAASGTVSWTSEAVSILETLAASASGRMAVALDAAARLVEGRRMPRDETALCEADLFDAADPETLAERDARAGSVEAPVRAAALRRDATPEPVARARLSQFIDSEWAERLTAIVRSVAAAPDALRERLSRTAQQAASVSDAGRPPRAPRARIWVVAAVAAVAVVVAGSMWPDPEGADPPAAAQTPAATATEAAPVQTSAAPPADTVAGASGSDLDAAARAVVDALVSCVGAAACEGVTEDPTAVIDEGAVTSPGAIVTLLDEYGGVAVFRVEAEAAPPQILVLVSVDGKWLVRDVYDTADQP